jgi:hypothetical protein
VNELAHPQSTLQNRKSCTICSIVLTDWTLSYKIVMDPEKNYGQTEE